MNDRFAEQRPAFAALARMLWGPERKPALILLTATVCLSAWWMLAQQHDATAAGLGSRADLTAYLRAAWPMSLSSFVLLGLVPMLLVVVVLRERLADYGLTLGDWKFGIFATLATAPLLVGLAYLSASSLPEGALPDRLRAWFGLHLVTQFLFYLGFEFHVRGFLQLGLGGRDGAALPIWLSIMPTWAARPPSCSVRSAVACSGA
jgi:hypothetical protein